MGELLFEGRAIPYLDRDSVASALYRSGVRTFTRSLKYHRRRGLYCGTGDCPNCLVTVDGRPGIRSCVAPCVDGMRVEREGGWPSVEHDLLSAAKHLGRLTPVGFYYKTFIHPRSAWPLAEKIIRRATGVGTLPRGARPARFISRHEYCDVLVIGAGLAGLGEAIDAAKAGQRVVVCDEHAIGDSLAPGPTLSKVKLAHRELAQHPGATVLERHTAIGIYEGPLVPLVGLSEIVQVIPTTIVIATGAVEAHGVFPGSDLPGVWLGRGAARMAGVHRVRPGTLAVVAISSEEGVEHLRTIAAAGTRVAAVLAPAALAERVPPGITVVEEGRVERAEGRASVSAAVIAAGERRWRLRCDAIVLSTGLSPRDELARMAGDGAVTLVGDAALEASGCDAVGDGCVCLCEDVFKHDLERAWTEGFTSSEILKRYSTATMGPCRGAMCARHVASFARRAAPDADAARAGARTTARPPVRPVTLAALASTVHERVDKRTALHDIHVRSGAVIDRAGGWLRPMHYGDWRAEVRAVREGVSVMDVGTLGKFLVSGRDAVDLLDHVLPCNVGDLAPGRSRYVIALDEAGYVFEDGLLSRLDRAFFLTSSSGFAPRMEAWLRNWADRFELHVHLVDQTAQLGAINVAGPMSRELLSRLCDDPLDAETLPYPGHRDIVVAGIDCRAVRTGFVGELSFELYHARSRGPDLWRALMEEGRSLNVQRHGLDALELLRLEKGHIYIGQDTLPDDTPEKLGLQWAVASSKPSFIGKAALQRMVTLTSERRLVGLEFSGEPVVDGLRGSPLIADGRIVGRVTSVERSDVLERTIGLGWIRTVAGEEPPSIFAGDVRARIASVPFYDPEGVRVRA